MKRLLKADLSALVSKLLFKMIGGSTHAILSFFEQEHPQLWEPYLKLCGRYSALDYMERLVLPQFVKQGWLTREQWFVPEEQEERTFWEVSFDEVWGEHSRQEKAFQVVNAHLEDFRKRARHYREFKLEDLPVRFPQLDLAVRGESLKKYDDLLETWTESLLDFVLTAMRKYAYYEKHGETEQYSWYLYRKALEWWNVSADLLDYAVEYSYEYHKSVWCVRAQFLQEKEHELMKDWHLLAKALYSDELGWTVAINNNGRINIHQQMVQDIVRASCKHAIERMVSPLISEAIRPHVSHTLFKGLYEAIDDWHGPHCGFCEQSIRAGQTVTAYGRLFCCDDCFMGASFS